MSAILHDRLCGRVWPCATVCDRVRPCITVRARRLRLERDELMEVLEQLEVERSALRRHADTLEAELTRQTALSRDSTAALGTLTEKLTQVQEGEGERDGGWGMGRAGKGCRKRGREGQVGWLCVSRACSRVLACPQAKTHAKSTNAAFVEKLESRGEAWAVREAELSSRIHRVGTQHDTEIYTLYSNKLT